MRIFATSRNTGLTRWGLDLVQLVYLGNSLEEAEIVVGEFSKYEREYDRGEEYRILHSALPRNVDWTMVKYYSADGYWYSIVSFEIRSLDENNINQIGNRILTVDEIRRAL